MIIPPPEPGLVIRYAYLWRSKEAREREDGVKDRPCAVVLAVKHAEGQTLAAVAPFTHSPPRNP